MHDQETYSVFTIRKIVLFQGYTRCSSVSSVVKNDYPFSFSGRPENMT